MMAAIDFIGENNYISFDYIKIYAKSEDNKII